MKRSTLIGLLLILIASASFANPATLTEADSLWSAGYFQESLNLVESALGNATEDAYRAELLWRRARAVHDWTNQRREELPRDQVLAAFLDGEDSASASLAINSESPWAYYWRSACLGSWGDAKGVLNALDKLPDMEADLNAALALDPRHGDSWSVLAIIKASVPGILGGSMDQAVSFDRKAVSLWNGRGEIPWEWYSELANHLYDRNWNASKRNSSLNRKTRNFQRSSGLVEGAAFFEGNVDFDAVPVYADQSLTEMSDRQESQAIYQWMQDALEAIPNRTPYQEAKLSFVRDRLENRDF